MRILYYPDSNIVQDSFAATIGFFDGVHKGHRYLISELRRMAEERGMQSMVITFERHPRQVLRADWQPQLLTTLEERISLIGQCGVDVLVVLRFDEAMATLSARNFMEHVLHDALRVDTLLTGYDNRFGHDRSEGFDDYVAYGQEMGMEVVQGLPLDVDSHRVSSSVIRRLLGEGDVMETCRCMGRPYSISGRVVHGEEIGRRLGFPTANLLPIPEERLIPASGVYAVKVGVKGMKEEFLGMMNIGTRPTFGIHRPTLEVYLLDFSGDLYDCLLEVRFIDRLRDEQRFASPTALIAQMETDQQQVRERLLATEHENVFPTNSK